MLGEGSEHTAIERAKCQTLWSWTKGLPSHSFHIDLQPRQEVQERFTRCNNIPRKVVVSLGGSLGERAHSVDEPSAREIRRGYSSAAQFTKRPSSEINALLTSLSNS